MAASANGDLRSMVESITATNQDEAEGNIAANCMDGDANTFLRSDPSTDSQLIITIHFRQPIKLYSMKFLLPDSATAENAPDNVKVYNTKDDSMDFSNAEDRPATETLEVEPGAEMQVKFVKYQCIHDLQFFIDGSKGGIDVPTMIRALVLSGQPVECTNMSDWKPVKG
jgi:hypothetical protein